MKIIFELDDSSENDDAGKAKRMMAVGDVFCLLSEIDERLRTVLKYDDPITRDELIEELRGMIHEENFLDLYN